MPNYSYKGSERRKYPRIPFGYIVKYKKCTPPKEFSKAKSKNLSLGGILLEVNKQYPVSTVFEIELDVPIDKEKHVFARVLGRVVRCSVIEPERAYDIAIQFTSVPARYSKQIQQLIDVFAKS